MLAHEEDDDIDEDGWSGLGTASAVRDVADVWLAEHDSHRHESYDDYEEDYSAGLGTSYAVGVRVVHSVTAIASGRNGVHCDGCRDRPWPDCAACGKPAVTALLDSEDPHYPHSLSLCAGCWGIVLACRGERQPSGPNVMHRKHARYTAAEVARITELRENAGWPWKAIAAELEMDETACYKAYHRAKEAAAKDPAKLTGFDRFQKRENIVHSPMPAIGLSTPPPEKRPQKRQRPAPSVPIATTQPGTREPSPTVKQRNVNARSALRSAPSQTGNMIGLAPDASRIPAPSCEDKAMRLSTSRGRQRSTRRVERKAIGNGR